VIETAAMEVPVPGDGAFFEFYPGAELNNDPSNWWSPNAKALEGLCKAAGFREVRILTKRPGFSLSKLLRRVTRYRAIAQARL
jgi:tRNA (mo5U34)-methyltransferase